MRLPALLRIPLVALAAALAASVSLHAADLVNTASTARTKALYNYVHSVSGKKIISGQMDQKYLQYIKDTTGKEPAMMGYDMNGVDKGTNTDAAKAIDWVNNRGGIAQVGWHWVSPDRKGDFYYNGFNLTAALADPDSDNYKAIIRDLDLAAVELKKLRDADVPVLWRPLHEAEGKWFWWGMSGGTSLKALWRLMYDRYTNYHGLNNLIWVWTSYGTEKGENMYPGDEYVDMIVWDYPNHAGSSWNMYKAIFGSKNKAFAIGEDGKLIDPSLIATQQWTYFLTWAYMVEDPAVTGDSGKAKNSKTWLSQVYNDSRVVTLSDMALESPYTYGMAPSIAEGSTSAFYNLATRGTIGAKGDQAMIAGFVVKGTEPQTVLVRAVGPGLKGFGINNHAGDPYVEIYDAAQKLIGGNDNHADSSAPISTRAGGFGLTPGSADAVAVMTLAPGNYTAVVRSRTTGGEIIVEVYQVD